MGKSIPWSQLPPEQKRVYSRPSEFGRRVLKIPLTNEQAAACDSFMPHRANVSVLCCNEAGKTTKILPTVILWHVCNFPRRGENGGVTATSGSWAQIDKQLMPALHAQASKFPKWRFLDTEIQRDGSPNFMAYAVTNPGLAEGFHGSEETPLLMLFDEAKSVRDSIIEAGEKRCRPQRLGLLSSPGYSQGKFYASHTSEAKYWTRHKITYESCPWIDRVEMRRVVEKAGGGDYERGLQDPLIRSAYFAEFMAFVKDALLSLADIEECIAGAPQARPGKRHAFCDFAGGGDENAIGIRIGNRVWLQDAWRDDNEMAAVGRFVRNFVLMKDKWGFRADEIEGDADGMGSPMVSRLHELGWEIIPFHGNSAPMDPRYYNRISELWYEGAKAIRERKIIIPDDEDFKAQAIDRVGKLHSEGLLWLESKKELFARQAREQRQKRSPDRADVVFGAAGDTPIVETVNIGGGQPERGPWHDDPDLGPDTVEREGSIPEEVLRGFDAGG